MVNIECIYNNFHIGTAFEEGMTGISFVLVPGANVTCTFTNQFVNYIAVGGTAGLRADGADPSALAASGSAGDYAALAGTVAAGVLALAAGGWYVRRRFRHRADLTRLR